MRKVMALLLILILSFPVYAEVLLVSDHYISPNATSFATRHSNKSKTHGDFENLKYSPDLLALDLSHNEITDLSFLRHCPKLKILILGDNDIVDITPIGELEDLEYLELWKNKINDVSPLEKLDKLIDLNICFNKIDDLTPLFNLTGLERLWIYNSNNYSKSQPVPENAVMELQKALPYTYIDHTSYSTLGGWREHPRYEVVLRIFRKEKRYLPWE